VAKRWMDQDATWYEGRPRPRPYRATWEASSLPKRGRSPQFSAHICCGQMTGWIKMPLGREVGLSPDNIVLDGNPAPPLQKRSEPQFSVHVYCGQTAGWMKMPLSTEVDLSQATMGRGPRSPLRKGHSTPLFSAHVCCGHGRPPQLLLSSC